MADYFLTLWRPGIFALVGISSLTEEATWMRPMRAGGTVCGVESLSSVFNSPTLGRDHARWFCLQEPCDGHWGERSRKSPKFQASLALCLRGESFLRVWCLMCKLSCPPGAPAHGGRHYSLPHRMGVQKCQIFQFFNRNWKSGLLGEM